jgi:hypothetical protein
MHKITYLEHLKLRPETEVLFFFQLGDSYRTSSVTRPDKLFAETLEFYVVADKGEFALVRVTWVQ